jgi:hypothetical protein
MYALSKDGTAAFLYDPAWGLAVPFYVEFLSREIFVFYPLADELEDHFIRHGSVDALKAAAGGHRGDIDIAVAKGRGYSETLRLLIENDDTSLDDITRRIIALEKSEKKRLPSKPVLRVAQPGAVPHEFASL